MENLKKRINELEECLRSIIGLYGRGIDKPKCDCAVCAAKRVLDNEEYLRSPS